MMLPRDGEILRLPPHVLYEIMILKNKKKIYSFEKNDLKF
jgi:hypothetical protein